MVRASFLRALVLAPTAVLSFVVPWTAVRAPVSSVGARPRLLSHAPSTPFRVGAPRGASNNQEEQTLTLVPALDDAKVRALFAWLSRAFAGDERYNNLMYALAAIWADNLEEGSGLSAMVADALKGLPDDEDVMLGAPLSLAERERASLGAMGAGQWMGQYRTRPHALLDVRELGDADEWAKGLPRGCRRTLAKAAAQNFTATSRRIVGGMPAPHSSLAHFRCVVEHEVRLLSGGVGGDGDEFFNALAQAINRYAGTTQQAGAIVEYRDEATGRVIAFAHEIRKGRVWRGQWFYATDAAAARYVWFHSVAALVARAAAAPGVDVVDLGPSGSDAFSDLKARYGFVSVDDWPAAADYTGPFVYDGGQRTAGVDGGLKGLIESLRGG